MLLRLFMERRMGKMRDDENKSDFLALEFGNGKGICLEKRKIPHLSRLGWRFCIEGRR